MNNGESWLMDPNTRDYVTAGGRPVITRSLKMPMYFRTLAHRKQWMYAPNDSWGSDFYLVHTKLDRSAPSNCQGISRRALSPLIEDGRALEIDVTATADRNGIVLDSKALEASGVETELTGLRPLGG